MPVPSKVGFSHFGIFVKSLPKMRAFYTRVLGFAETDRGIARGRPIVFLSRDPSEHHQIVLVEGRTGSLDDLVVNQISLRVGSLGELRKLFRAITKRRDVTDLNPTDHGNAWSLYFRDPEKNRIELFVDSPWYVEQPRVEPLDLTQSEAAIKTRTKTAIEDHPTFMPYSKWRADFARKLKRSLARKPKRARAA